MTRTRVAKVGNRQRWQQALTLIAGWEAQQGDWDAISLAEAMGVSRQQARSLLALLCLKGFLVLSERVVRKQGLTLTTVARAPDAVARAA